MKKAFVLALALALLALPMTLAAATKTYQVTGPVLEIRPDAIVVQKGSEKWEIARDSSTKVTGDMKVGSKVTITYRMTASDVTVKADTGTKAPAKKK